MNRDTKRIHWVHENRCLLNSQRRTFRAPDEPCESGNELKDCTENLKIEFRKQEITDTQNRDESTGCTQSLKRRPHRASRPRQEHAKNTHRASTEPINGVGSMAEAHLKTTVHYVKQAANTITRTTEWQRKSADPKTRMTPTSTNRMQQDFLKTTTSGHVKVKNLILYVASEKSCVP